MRVDGYNQASAGPSGNQGQMMGISGRGGAIGPEGTANMETPLMSENGAMVMFWPNLNFHNNCQEQENRHLALKDASFKHSNMTFPYQVYKRSSVRCYFTKYILAN